MKVKQLEENAMNDRNKKEEKTMKDEKKLYAVWVGGIADYFYDEVSAESSARYWKEEGYDDVQVEVIGASTPITEG